MKVILLLVVVFALLAMISLRAECSACQGQYCAFDVDCPQSCHCAKAPASPSGSCW